MSEWLRDLERLAPDLTVRKDVPMKNLTTFRIGGPAEYFAEPQTREELAAIHQIAAAYGIPFFLMGHGSNLLVKDGGIPGITVRLGSRFSKLTVSGDTALYAQAGILLADLAAKAQKMGLSGLQFASGIPGSAGGGVFMNAGAYGGEMAQVVTSAECFDGASFRTLTRDELAFSYRHSAAMDKSLMITGVCFQLTPGDPEEIRAEMNDLQLRRKEKQPLDLPSAGSFFKRPAGGFAAKLIDDAGLKGFRIGGAMVSEKHAGFVVNTGNATAGDVLRLMEAVRERVFRNAGIQLEPEVRIIGVD